MSKRDPQGEAAFLRAVGAPEFAELVTRRLDEQDPEFGDSFALMALPKFWDELASELVDAPAWGLLLVRRYKLDGADDITLSKIRGALVAAARHARQAHDLISEPSRLALGEGE